MHESAVVCLNSLDCTKWAGDVPTKRHLPQPLLKRVQSTPTPQEFFGVISAVHLSSFDTLALRRVVCLRHDTFFFNRALPLPSTLWRCGGWFVFDTIRFSLTGRFQDDLCLVSPHNLRPVLAGHPSPSCQPLLSFRSGGRNLFVHEMHDLPGTLYRTAQHTCKMCQHGRTASSLITTIAWSLACRA